jgi:hypothetical protein
MISSCYKDKEELLYGSDCSNTSGTPGPLFTEVISKINSSCAGSGCHTNGGNAGGYNFDQRCSIIDHWSKIQETCVDRQTMPIGNPFSASEKQIIMNWVNAGHKFSD